MPTLVDIKSGKAVNNDSGILLTELATTWKAYETADAPDVFPEDKQAEILGYDQKKLLIICLMSLILLAM